MRQEWWHERRQRSLHGRQRRRLWRVVRRLCASAAGAAARRKRSMRRPPALEGVLASLGRGSGPGRARRGALALALARRRQQRRARRVVVLVVIVRRRLARALFAGRRAARRRRLALERRARARVVDRFGPDGRRKGRRGGVSASGTSSGLEAKARTSTCASGCSQPSCRASSAGLQQGARMRPAPRVSTADSTFDRRRVAGGGPTDALERQPHAALARVVRSSLCRHGVALDLSGEQGGTKGQRKGVEGGAGGRPTGVEGDAEAKGPVELVRGIAERRLAVLTLVVRQATQASFCFSLPSLDTACCCCCCWGPAPDVGGSAGALPAACGGGASWAAEGGGGSVEAPAELNVGGASGPPSIVWSAAGERVEGEALGKVRSTECRARPWRIGRGLRCWLAGRGDGRRAGRGRGKGPTALCTEPAGGRELQEF